MKRNGQSRAGLSWVLAATNAREFEYFQKFKVL